MKGRFVLSLPFLILGGALTLSAARATCLWMEWGVVVVLALISMSPLNAKTKVLGTSMAVGVAWVFSVGWVVPAIIRFGSLSSTGAFVAMLVLVLLQTLPFALVVLIAHLFRRDAVFPLVFAVLYATAEGVWPWLAPYSCAVSIVDTPLVQMLPWLGRGGFALLASGIGATLPKANLRLGAWIIGCAVFLIPAVFQPSTDAVPISGLRAAVVQMDLSGRDFRAAPDVVFAEHLRTSRALLAVNDTSPEIIFWGESSSPFMGAEQWHRQQVEASFQRGTSLMFGASVLDPTADVPTNSVLAVGRCSDCRYDKQLLVPFAESVPYFLGRWMRRRSNVFRSDHRNKPIRVHDLSIGTPICYEAMFPRVVDDLLEGGAQLLFNPVNDTWVPDVRARQAHRDLARLAAAEVGLPAVRLVNGGPSEVWDARGKIRLLVPAGTTGALPVRVPLAPPRNYCRTWRHLILLGLTLGSAAIVFLAAFRLGHAYFEGIFRKEPAS